MKIIAIILLLAPSALGQYKPPATCNPGDLIDGYSGGYVCAAPNKWVGNVDYVYGYKEGEWMPDCQWAYRDDAKKWHCPYETASGMVVGFIPCKYTKNVETKGSPLDHSQPYYDGVGECEAWAKETEERIRLMRTGITVQSTEVKDSESKTLDHANPKLYTCPQGFKLITFEHYDNPMFGDENICWKSKD